MPRPRRKLLVSAALASGVTLFACSSRVVGNPKGAFYDDAGDERSFPPLGTANDAGPDASDGAPADVTIDAADAAASD